MPGIVVVGGQWGDEGKGRVVDPVARKAHVVARYSGGSNAGHTVVNQLGEFRLHLVPAGIFYTDKVCVIGNGVVIDPAVLLEEIETLEERGVSVEKLRISDRCHIVMPYHPIIHRLAGEQRRAFEDVYATCSELGAKIAPFVADTGELVQAALDQGETVLLEGAQGALLDLDAGTYEFVTSAVPSSLAAGAALGMGIGPTKISKVLGVYKAYQTRVGNGPMPTELLDEMGETLRERGWEYAATTGRPRRCWWLHPGGR